MFGAVPWTKKLFHHSILLTFQVLNHLKLQQLFANLKLFQWKNKIHLIR